MTDETGSTATATAQPNIALVKYWGKRDTELILPVAGSLSLTLDEYPTTTTVEVTGDDADAFTLNGTPGTPVQTGRVQVFLDIVRQLAGSRAHARVDSISEIPAGAGLASSASGFAALAVAAASAYGLQLDRQALSRLARRGSGSAARSVIRGLSVWHPGTDLTSFAEPIDGPDIRMVIVMINRGTKPVSSRDGMIRTAITSPYFEAWASSTDDTLAAALEACAADDFTRLGRITELHALRMHALIQSSDPPIRYLTARSVAVFDAVETLRAQGVEAYATADAGPNVVVITRPADAERVAGALAEFGETSIAGPGEGARLVDNAANVGGSIA